MKFISAKYNRQNRRVYKVIPIRKLIREKNQLLHEKQMKSFGRTSPLNTIQSNAIMLQLRNLGFDRYLKYGIGGSMTDKRIKLMIKHTSTFLDWAIDHYLFVNYNKNTNIIHLLFRLFNNKPKCLYPFLCYLEKKLYKPSTCNSYIWSLSNACDWLVSVHQTEFANTSNLNLHEFHNVTKSAHKKYKQADKQRVNAMKDMEELVQLGRWPEEGLPALQIPVIEEMEWAKVLVIHSYIYLLILLNYLSISRKLHYKMDICCRDLSIIGLFDYLLLHFILYLCRVVPTLLGQLRNLRPIPY